MTANIIPFALKPKKTPASEEYSGGCPVCGGSDGFVDHGDILTFYCHLHRQQWCSGTFNPEIYFPPTTEGRRTLDIISGYTMRGRDPSDTWDPSGDRIKELTAEMVNRWTGGLRPPEFHDRLRAWAWDVLPGLSLDEWNKAADAARDIITDNNPGAA